MPERWKRLIIKNYFLGLGRNENARSVQRSHRKYSPGSVSSEIKRFSDLARKIGLDVATSEYDVVEEINELRKIAEFLQKNDIAVEELVPGSSILQNLKRMQIDFDDLEPFVMETYKYLHREKGYSAQKIVHDCAAIASIEKGTSRPISEILIESDQIEKDLPERREQLKKIREEIETATKSLEDLRKQHGVTEESIQKFNSAKQVLAGFGIEIEKIDKFGNFLQNAIQLNYNPQDVISDLNKIKSLQRDKSELQMSLGRLQEDLEKTQDGLKNAEERLKEVAKEHQDKQTQLQAYYRLQSLGINDEALLNWDKTVQDSKLSVGAVTSELSKTTSLITTQNQVKENVSKLKNEEAILRTSLDTLTTQKQGLENSIKVMEETTIKSISDISEKAKSSLTSLDEKAKTMPKEIQKTAESTIEEIKQNVNSATSKVKSDLDNLEASAKKDYEGIKSVLEGARGDIENVGRALEAGRLIGKYETLLPVFNLLETSTGNPQEVLPVMRTILMNFRTWAGTHRMGVDITQQLDATILEVSKEVFGFGGKDPKQD